MTLFIILFVLGVLTGYVIRPLFTKHKHDYELVLHKKLDDIGVSTITYKNKSSDGPDFKINFDLIYVSHKKCKTCNHTVTNISNGSDRVFCPDWDFINDKIQLALVKDREEKDRELFDSMNKRLAEKDVLTSPEAPYNAVTVKPTVSE